MAKYIVREHRYRGRDGGIVSVYYLARKGWFFYKTLWGRQYESLEEAREERWRLESGEYKARNVKERD